MLFLLLLIFCSFPLLFQKKHLNHLQNCNLGLKIKHTWYQFIVVQKSWQIVMNLDFNAAWFFIIWFCSWGQIGEIKRCCQVGTLGHPENWVLVSKMERRISKSTFLKNLSVNILLEIWNPLSGSAPNLDWI